MSGSLEMATVHSMLDWPEASQTSPTRTFLRVRELLAEMVTSRGEAGSMLVVSRMASHLPLSLAVASTEAWPILMVTLSPLSAQPKMGVLGERWRTMLSEKGAGRVTSADEERASKDASAMDTDRRTFIRISFDLQKWSDLFLGQGLIGKRVPQLVILGTHELIQLLTELAWQAGALDQLDYVE